MISCNEGSWTGVGMYSAPVKSEGCKYDRRNLRDISLLSEVDKLYGRVLIKKVRGGSEYAVEEVRGGALWFGKLIRRVTNGTEYAIGEEQCGFGRVEGVHEPSVHSYSCVSSV